MNQVHPAQALALCHTCQVRHPCRTLQAFLDFCERHPQHATSYLDRDWLHEQHGSTLAAWDPIKQITSVVEYAPNANVNVAFGTSTSITQTLASLATGSARESTAVDNSSNLYLDALVRVQVKLQSGSPASDKTVYVYAYGSEDGTNYTDNATGSDAAITLRAPSNLDHIGAIATPDSGALTYKSRPMGVAKAFDGILPRAWGIVVENKTNITFDATEGNHAKAYSGVFATVF